MCEGLTEKELIYLAGFFDGEGSVGIYRRGQGKNCPVMTMTLVQNRGPLAEAMFIKWKDALGGNIFVNRSSSGKAKMQWQASWRTAENILRAILPYLHLKLDQVELCLRWQESKPVASRLPNGRMMRVVITDEMESLIDRVKAMKQGELFVSNNVL